MLQSDEAHLFLKPSVHVLEVSRGDFWSLFGDSEVYRVQASGV